MPYVKGQTLHWAREKRAKKINNGRGNTTKKTWGGGVFKDKLPNHLKIECELLLKINVVPRFCSHRNITKIRIGTSTPLHDPLKINPISSTELSILAPKGA